MCGNMVNQCAWLVGVVTCRCKPSKHTPACLRSWPACSGANEHSICLLCGSQEPTKATVALASSYRAFPGCNHCAEDEGSEVIAASTADPDSRAHAQAIGEVQNEAGTQSKGSAGIEHNHLQPTLADAAEQLNSVRVSENAELTTSAQPA